MSDRVASIQYRTTPLRTRTRVYREAQTRAPGEYKSPRGRRAGLVTSDLPPRPRDLRCLLRSPSARARGISTSGDRTTGVTATSTSSAGTCIGTPLACASADSDVFPSVVIVGGDAEAEAGTESSGGGGSGRSWRFDWLQWVQTQSLDLSENRDRVR
ncbi:hypothetical protein BJY52DRAFT_1271030 [Lactarius psammicola]|nr:hypothetical protein BJY52DRAFT_1271030 [Lactarius psammicola]